MRGLTYIVAAWLAISALAMPVATAHAQDATPAAVTEYRDPHNRFSTPVPTNWTVEEHDRYAVLRDPDGDLAIYLLVVVADKVTVASAIALGIVGVEPDDLPDATQTVPSAEGVDETTVITYLSADEESIVQVAGQRVGNLVYVLVFSGTIEGATKRASQVQIISSGFKITSLGELDISTMAPNPITPKFLAELQAYVADLQQRLAVPGASVAIVAGGKIVYAHGFGVKELGGNDPVDADTQMMIGSVTKSMTTMMMATEVDDGLMSWDDPAISILPEFAVADPELTKSITVRNLVCACTGVPRRDLEWVFNANDLSAEDVIASLSGFEFFTDFGEAFQYSNQMVATGGYIAAAAAGGVYGDLFDAYLAQMQERVFDPIGMPNTSLSFADVVIGGNYAIPHGVNIEAQYEPILLSLEETLVPMAPAGLVWSSVNDMARYLLTEIDRGVGPDGNRVVSEENLAQTWKPQVAVDGSTSYGLGWLIQDYHGIKLIQHGGNTFGFSSDLAFLPDEGIGIVVLANGQSANSFTEGVRYRLLEMLYDLPHEFDDQITFYLDQTADLYAGLAALLQPVPAPIAAGAVGTYLNDSLGEVTLFVVDGELILDAGEFEMRIELFDDGNPANGIEFVSADPPFPGTPFTLEESPGGDREIVLDIGTDTYIFTDIDALPDAAEDATPLAAD